MSEPTIRDYVQHKPTCRIWMRLDDGDRMVVPAEAGLPEYVCTCGLDRLLAALAAPPDRQERQLLLWLRDAAVRVIASGLEPPTADDIAWAQRELEAAPVPQGAPDRQETHGFGCPHDGEPLEPRPADCVCDEHGETDIMREAAPVSQGERAPEREK